MPRPEKVQAVEEIAQRFDEAEAVFLTEYRGLSVAQQQALRRALREAGASYKVLKMSLTRRALEGRPEAELTEWLVGPTAVAFAAGDPVPVAKALDDFARENEALVVKAGTLNGEILPPEMVAKLARIESREILLAKIAGAAKGPMSKLAGMLGSFTRDAASMFSQLLDKKESEAPVAEAEEPAAAKAEEPPTPTPDESTPDESAPADSADTSESEAEQAEVPAEDTAEDTAEDAAADGEADTAADTESEGGEAEEAEAASQTDGDGEPAAEEE